MQADILVLGHDFAGLEGVGDVKRLLAIGRRRLQAAAQVVLRSAGRERDAVQWADVDTSVALDAERTIEHRLDVAVQAALRLSVGKLAIESQLYLHLHVVEGDGLVSLRYAVALVVGDVVVVAPLVDAHLLADEADVGRRPSAYVVATAEFVDGDRGIVPMRHSPDYVLGAEGGIAAEEHLRQSGLHGQRIDPWHAPAVELQANVALDPWEGVLLPDRDEHIVAGHMNAWLAGRHQAAPAVFVNALDHPLEEHAGKQTGRVREGLGRKEVVDGDAFMHGVLLLPRLGLHFCQAPPHAHLDLFAAKAPRGAAAVHGRIAAPEHDDPSANLVDGAEGPVGEPINTAVDFCPGLSAA